MDALLEVAAGENAPGRQSLAPERILVIGAVLFTLVLIVSAMFEADIRWLHFLQAWMYVATVYLAARKNRIGYFIGLSAAGFWVYANLFVTTFFLNGLHELRLLISTGHAARPDQLISVPAWFGNVLVVIGSAWGYARLREKSVQDAVTFLLTFALTTGFFAADMAIFQPRYLPLFRGALHPHWPGFGR